MTEKAGSKQQVVKESVEKEPNVLTGELIKELKEKYPRGIYKSTILDETYIWRPIFRDEYVSVVNADNGDILGKEEVITSICLLFPQLSLEEVQALDAGIPTTLADNIMAKSGFEASSVEKL